jgi:hypothetical protein
MDVLANIWAGCDVDCRIKLFRVVDDMPIAMTLDGDWLEVLRSLGAKPGEMLVVSLARESQFTKPQETNHA